MSETVAKPPGQTLKMPLWLAGLLKPVPSSERERLRKQILADEEWAKGLGVSGTPSFFVCRPDGRVLRLPDLETLERVLPQ